MPLKVTFDQGLNTSRDESQIGNGELRVATGIHYRPGDTRAHKIGGTVEFGDTGTGKSVDGLAVLQFDEGGSDKIVALSDKVLYGADISASGTSGSLSSIKSGLGTRATSLSAAHFNDRWYLGLADQNVTVEADGTVRSMGMRAPSTWDTNSLTPDTGDTILRPAANAGDFTNGASAYDVTSGTTADTGTSAFSTLSSISTATHEFSWTGTSDTGTGRKLNVRWFLSGIPVLPDFPGDTDFDDVGGTFDSGFIVSVVFEISEDGGNNWTEFLNLGKVRQARPEEIIAVDITDSLELNGNLAFRATLKYLQGDSPATLRIVDINANNGSSVTNFSSAEGGHYYGLAEYDEDRGLYSPVIVTQARITLTTQNHVDITLPSAATNSNSTHWLIYRTTDGGAATTTLGQVAKVPITATAAIDTFEKAAHDIISYPLARMVRAVVQSDAAQSNPLFFPMDTPPPRLRRIRTFQGSLVGFPTDNKRALAYSAAGQPESWPEINTIDSFPFEEYDELYDGVTLGEVFIIAARGTIMRLTSLPRVVNSVRDASRVDRIQGAPGCVGEYALTSYSVAGEPRAAWISPYGVYHTNGDTIQRVSDDIDWLAFDGLDKSGWVLHWNAQRLCLEMHVSLTGGSNDRYYLIHMAPEHRKNDGQPKWTGPHYGAFKSVASGQVGDTHRLYGGHASDGSVYVMDIGGADASEAYSGTTVPLIVKTGKFYADDRNWSALDARVYHTDFGGGQTCTLDYEVGNDDEAGGSYTLSQTVSLSGAKGTQLDLAQRCQWAQATITHEGLGRGALRDLEIQTVSRGRSGSTRVA